MIQLKNGENYSRKERITRFDNLILSKNNYSNEKVDWHYHENFYFNYLLEGQLYETNKRNSYTLTPGSLLFHNWQDAHINKNQKELSRGFHVEIGSRWFQNNLLTPDCIEGSLRVDNPYHIILFDKIYKESLINDVSTELSIQTLLLQLFGGLLKTKDTFERKIPTWVHSVKEILHTEYEEKLSLKYLSDELGIHPIHLSSDFPKYFNQLNIGDYIRCLKVNSSLVLIRTSSLNITEIANLCGFSDQSHFIRIFKKYLGITPFQYLKKYNK